MPLTLKAALNNTIQTYTSSNPLSQKHHQSARKYLPGGNTRSVLYTSPFPVTFTSASGTRLTSLDGVTYLDFLGEYTAGLFGHSNPVIKKAINDALEDGWSFGGVGEWEARLAGLICERFKLDMCRFTNSGTEANLMAIAVAKVWTGKRKILVFERAYHGSLLSFPARDAPSPLNTPHEFIIAPYNNIDYLNNALTAEDLGSLAAILVEPMQGAGGCFPASKEFLTALKEVADRSGALLIFDEVMTSRLHIGGLQAHFGVKPDLTTMGKYLGGGSSFGCFGGRGDIMELFDQSRTTEDGRTLSHPGTFNNNVVTMRAGVTACGLITEEGLGRVNALGEKLREDLNELCVKYGVTEKVWVTGMGSLMAIHFGKKTVDTRKPDAEDMFWFWLMEKGIYIARRGFVALTLEHTVQDVQVFLEAAEGFLATFAPML